MVYVETKAATHASVSGILDAEQQSSAVSLLTTLASHNRISFRALFAGDYRPDPVSVAQKGAGAEDDQVAFDETFTNLNSVLAE
jgi:hypothetical protein